jgi:Protein of unknown function, DUF547
MKPVVATLVALLLAAPALANPFVPKAELWARWQRSGAGAEVDYADWAMFLTRYRSVGADGVVRIAYGKVGKADAAKLDALVRRLEAAPVDRMTRPQQLAYWINLYNAATVRLVTARHPVSSIRRIDGGLLNLGPWNKPLLEVAGERLSLNDIEHRIIRPVFRDPRIHFAVNCAAIGCPDLAARPFVAATLDADLDAATRAFINHPRGLRAEKGRLAGSSIFDWYAVDFGGPPGVIRFARRYADDSTRTLLQGRSRIDRFSYDWGLNE